MMKIHELYVVAIYGGEKTICISYLCVLTHYVHVYIVSGSQTAFLVVCVCSEANEDVTPTR